MKNIVNKKKKKRKNFKRRPCMFCIEKMEYVDYKNIEVISKILILMEKFYLQELQVHVQDIKEL